IIVRFGIDDGPTRFWIDALRPRHCGIGLSRYECTGHAIKNVVKPVLVRLHDDLARAPVDEQVRENESLHAVEIPRVAGSVLVVPLEFAGVGFHGEYRAHVKIVLALRLSEPLRPWAAITGAYINQIGLGIIRDAVPNGAPTAQLPPITGPCFSGFF